MGVVIGHTLEPDRISLGLQEDGVHAGGRVMSGGKLVVEQESEARITVRIQATSWDGETEVGRIEIDLARHLDPRVSITVSRLDERRTGSIEMSMR